MNLVNGDHPNGDDPIEECGDERSELIWSIHQLWLIDSSLSHGNKVINNYNLAAPYCYKASDAQHLLMGCRLFIKLT